MFYQLIQRKRDEWLGSEDCPIRSLLAYMEKKGMLRDAQIEAIKTYLFLKIACGNKPLWQLFSEGNFLSINLRDVSLTVRAREVLETNTAAATLYEYACLKDADGNLLAPNLKNEIEEYPDDIDYEQVFRDIFYGVRYPDYIFSLPMGAGKTFLMAAFIYLDLYFSKIESDNPVFAHNFMLLAPSGLKSSILPSIKKIRDFDPTWVLPEPSASQIRKEIQFEVLDEQKSAKKSNTVKNPNAQKINNHQPFQGLRGLVAVTNAEKVILDKIDQDKGNDPLLYTDEEWEEVRMSNELRNIIGKIPHLSIFIDEVHHASDSDIKLRQVVNKWTENETFNSVLGFSGTPYLASADSVTVTPRLSLKNKNLANAVYYYPLIEGVGNFLKSPKIKYSDVGWEDIVGRGVTEFLDLYGDKVYADGTCAKLAIYCGKIDNLETNIYPLVANIVSERGMNPTEVILKYHDGNKQFPAPEGAETAFKSLDTSLSKIRIVLLVQIGKEGWDCKSLTGVILPQKGACPKNMVLQTSCRCLRQVVRKERETALIWLNEENAKTLNNELKKQQHTSIEALNNGGNNPLSTIRQFSRMDKLRVPPISFIQLKVTYHTLVLDKELNTYAELKKDSLITASQSMLIKEENLKGEIKKKEELTIDDEESNLPVSFHSWLHTIEKESFGTWTVRAAKPFFDLLRGIFDRITTIKDGTTYLDGKYNQREVRAGIRKAFTPKRTIEVNEEKIPREAKILNVEKLEPLIEVAHPEKYFPDQDKVQQIVADDKGGKRLKKDIQTTINTLSKMSNTEATIKALTDNPDNYERVGEEVNDHTYHYLPYHFDSGLEKDYFSKSLLTIIVDNQLEVYFNGDDTLTDFKIRCYKQVGNDWRYIGKYVPDFLLLRRGDDGNIRQVLIIETKGEGYSTKFADRKTFMSKFVSLNNEYYGYPRFDFLYIEDTLPKDQMDKLTIEKIHQFFQS
jgi:type III restriction enzyme